MNDQELVEAFVSRREERLTREWRTYAPRQPIASDLMPCVRYQVLRVLAWEVRPPPDAEGIAVMEQGRVMEPAMIRQLQDEGFEIVELQAPFQIRQPIRPGEYRVIVSGMIDGKIRLPGPDGSHRGERIPFDCKDTNEYAFDSIDTEQDLIDYSPWTRKWRDQVQMYCLGEENERGLLILGFRGQRKAIVIHLDYAHAERLLDLCTKAVQMIEVLQAANVPADRLDDALNKQGVPYHHEQRVCRFCPFRDRACFPPRPTGDRIQMREDLAADVARYVELSPLVAERNRIQKRIKAETEGFPSTVAGEYIVEGEVRLRQMSAQEAKPERVLEHWGFDVRPVGERK